MNTSDLLNPILSIITVNYNNNNGLIQTIESVKEQSFISYEHIIIDAASTDNSLNTIKKYEQESRHLTYWISETDKGIYDGMNKGIKQSKGDYLLFLNSGDCLLKDILQKIPFDGTQYIYGDAKIFSNRKEIIRKYSQDIDLIYLINNSFHHQSCFIHKSLFINNRYDCDYRIISDWAHCFQSIIMRQCSYKYIPLIISECDGNGISSNYLNLQEERFLWIKRNFPPIISSSYIDCAKLDESGFRPIIQLIYNTRKFNKRIKKIVLLLYKINKLFSNKR